MLLTGVAETPNTSCSSGSWLCKNRKYINIFFFPNLLTIFFGSGYLQKASYALLLPDMRASCISKSRYKMRTVCPETLVCLYIVCNHVKTDKSSSTHSILQIYEVNIFLHVHWQIRIIQLFGILQSENCPKRQRCMKKLGLGGVGGGNIQSGGQTHRQCILPSP